MGSTDINCPCTPICHFEAYRHLCTITRVDVILTLLSPINTFKGKGDYKSDIITIHLHLVLSNGFGCSNSVRPHFPVDHHLHQPLPTLPTQEPPTRPSPWPLLGNLPAIFNSKTPPHVTYANLARTHGDLMLLWFGHTPIVVVSDKAAAEEVLKTYDKALSGRHIPSNLNFSKEAMETSLVWSDWNDYWKQVRRLLRTDVFSPKMLRIQEGVREQKVRQLVEFMKSKQGESVNVRPAIFGTVLNVLGNAVFSKDLYDVVGGKGDVVGLEFLIR